MRFGGILRSVAVAAAVACSLLMGAVQAFAQPYPGGGQTPPVVGGKKFFPGDTARTGSDLLLFILIGLLALLIGLALRALTRREAQRES